MDRARRHAHHYHTLGLIFGALLVIPFTVAAIAIWIARPNILSAISAVTEQVSVSVDGSDQNKFLIRNGRILAVGAPHGCVADGSFTPAGGAEVTFTRSLDGPLNIQIIKRGGGIVGVLNANGLDTPYSSPVTFVFDHADTKCRSPGSLRLPISGQVTLGDDYRAASDEDTTVYVLQSGRIDSFVRTNDRLFGLPLPVEGALYPVGSISLPAGSRLRECAETAPRGATPTKWRGYAEARLGYTDIGDRDLTVALTTTAERLAMTTPGGAKSGGSFCGGSSHDLSDREDVLSVSLLARLVGDPNLAGAGLAVGFILLVVQTLVAFWSVRPKPARRRTEKVKAT